MGKAKVASVNLHVTSIALIDLGDKISQLTEGTPDVAKQNTMWLSVVSISRLNTILAHC